MVLCQHDILKDGAQLLAGHPQQDLRPGEAFAESGKRDDSRPLLSGRVENWRAHGR
jgi:hypothetical protein